MWLNDDDNMGLDLIFHILCLSLSHLCDYWNVALQIALQDIWGLNVTTSCFLKPTHLRPSGYVIRISEESPLVVKLVIWQRKSSLRLFSIGLLFDIDKKGFENEKTPIPCMGTIPKYNCHLAVPWWWPRLIWSCRINGDWSKSQTNYIFNLNMLNLPRTVPLLKNCLCITCSKSYSPCLILAFVLFSSLFGFISFLSSRALISNWNPSFSP